MKTSNRKPHSRVSVAKQLRRALMPAETVSARRTMLRVRTGKLTIRSIITQQSKAAQYSPAHYGIVNV